MEAAILLAVAVVAFGVAWLLWGRPLAAARAEASKRLEDYTRAITELAGATKEIEELKPLRAKGEELAALKAGAEARDKAHAEQVAQLLATGEALKGQFEQLAGATLQKSHAHFIAMATETFEAQKAKTNAGIAELIQPMRDTLVRYETRLGEVEAVRAESYGKLNQLLEQVSKGQDRVSGETMKLATALRSSGKVAGRWGEEQCRNVLEQAGLVEGVDFEVQDSVTGDAGRQRPDFTINLPGERKLVIDVKCSLDSYVAAAEADGDEDRARHLLSHARAVRAHATGLASKSYEKSVGGAVDFVVLFVPGENFLSAAIEHDRALLGDFMSRRLVLAGPINLIAVARTVAAMRDQARLAQQAAEIAKLGKELYDSLRIMGGNILGVQKSLESAVVNFNKFSGQFGSRVMGRAKRFEQLGATTGLEPLPELKGIEQVPMPVASSDLLPPPLAEAAE